MDKVKNEPFFKWPNKMARDPAKRNQSLYCQYHLEPRHTTKNCRNLKYHLDQLVQKGKLRQGQANPKTWRGSSLRPPIGTINVLFAALGWTGSYPSRVMSVAWLPAESNDRESKKAKKRASPVLDSRMKINLFIMFKILTSLMCGSNNFYES